MNRIKTYICGLFWFKHGIKSGKLNTGNKKGSERSLFQNLQTADYLRFASGT
ncbi:hypothetical protein MP213Fo_03090 [Pseudochrobactrum sp. MP213Fo]